MKIAVRSPTLPTISLTLTVPKKSFPSLQSCSWKDLRYQLAGLAFQLSDIHSVHNDGVLAVAYHSEPPSQSLSLHIACRSVALVLSVHDMAHVDTWGLLLHLTQQLDPSVVLAGDIVEVVVILLMRVVAKDKGVVRLKREGEFTGFGDATYSVDSLHFLGEGDDTSIAAKSDMLLHIIIQLKSLRNDVLEINFTAEPVLPKKEVRSLLCL